MHASAEPIEPGGFVVKNATQARHVNTGASETKALWIGGRRFRAGGQTGETGATPAAASLLRWRRPPQRMAPGTLLSLLACLAGIVEQSLRQVRDPEPLPIEILEIGLDR